MSWCSVPCSLQCAALTRSAAMTFGAAMLAIAFDAFLNVLAKASVAPWLLLADPFAAMPISRGQSLLERQGIQFTVANGIPAAQPPALAGRRAMVVTITCWRYRMELVPGGRQRFWRARATRAPAQPQPTGHYRTPAAIRPRRRRCGNSSSQLRMDWRGVWLSPLFWIVLATGAGKCVQRSVAPEELSRSICRCIPRPP